MRTGEVDDVKREVARHWQRRALHFDDDFGHAIKTAAERAAWERILDLVLGGGSPLRALDVGCGTGFLSLALAERGHLVRGVDLASQMLALARQKAARRGLSVAFAGADAEALPFPSSSFDLVASRHLLWTLPHPEEAIEEWIRVLRPGGRLVLIEGKLEPSSPPPPLRENARTSAEYGAIRDRLPFFDGRAREEMEALLRAHGLLAVGGDSLPDLLAAEAERAAGEGFAPPRRQRYAVWGNRYV